jgi:Membrane proteins related to metalloendopeptidases
MSIKSPFEGGQFRVTSIIGIRDIPELGIVHQPHYGLDIVGMSSKKITAVAAGTVARSTIITDKNNATWQWGNYVRVDGDDGYFYYYCHMSQRLINVGQRVEVGDVLGIEGATGQVTGSHLHLEMRKGTTQCALPAQTTDPCNVATHIGIANAVGMYTAQIATSAASESVTDEEYIRRIVEKVGYDNPGFARWAFDQIKHNDRNALFRKLWEALNK